MSTPLQPHEREVWSNVIVHGPEAASYLQGQLSQDLAGDAAWPRPALVLAPDSVVITSCDVAPDVDGFVLTVPTSLAEAARDQLQRFKLRTRVTIDIESDVPGRFEFVEQRVAARWPGAGEFERRLTPHSFGRTFVHATVSFAKGCFTGQELVGRLDARSSSVPWRLVHFDADSLDDVETVIASVGPANPRGVTTVVLRDGRVEGLAVAHRTVLATVDAGSAFGVRLTEVG